jgi:hypothetical protein
MFIIHNLYKLQVAWCLPVWSSLFSQLIPALIVALGGFWLPFSPRWRKYTWLHIDATRVTLWADVLLFVISWDPVVMKGRVAEAETIFKRLRAGDDEVRRSQDSSTCYNIAHHLFGFS